MRSSPAHFQSMIEKKVKSYSPALSPAPLGNTLGKGKVVTKNEYLKTNYCLATFYPIYIHKHLFSYHHLILPNQGIEPQFAIYKIAVLAVILIRPLIYYFLLNLWQATGNVINLFLSIYNQLCRKAQPYHRIYKVDLLIAVYFGCCVASLRTLKGIIQNKHNYSPYYPRLFHVFNPLIHVFNL